MFVNNCLKMCALGRKEGMKEGREGGWERGREGILLGHVADRVLLLRLGVRPEPLRWESSVQDIGPLETSRPHVISISKSSPRDLHHNAKAQLHSTTSKLQCWTPHAKQLARQVHNPTH